MSIFGTTQNCISAFVIPQHAGDLAPKTIKSILVQAEMMIEEFIALL